MDDDVKLDLFVINHLPKECQMDLELRYGYDLDWALLGKHRHLYNKRPFDIPIFEYVKWVSTNVFHPKKLMLDNIKTSQIRLRIAISMLNNLTIPKNIKIDIAENIFALFYARKLVFDKYLFEQILELPFIDNKGDFTFMYKIHKEEEYGVSIPPF